MHAGGPGSPRAGHHHHRELAPCVVRGRRHVHCDRGLAQLQRKPSHKPAHAAAAPPRAAASLPRCCFAASDPTPLPCRAPFELQHQQVGKQTIECTEQQLDRAGRWAPHASWRCSPSQLLLWRLQPGQLSCHIHVERAANAVHNAQGNPAADDDAQTAAHHVCASQECTQETKQAEADCGRGESEGTQ